MARKRPAPPYLVYRLKTWDAFLKLIADPPYANWAYRGERDERWPLYSSLSRYLQSFGMAPGAWTRQEARILRVFKRKAHQFVEQAARRGRRFSVAGAHATSRRAHAVDRFHVVAIRRGLLRAGAHYGGWRHMGSQPWPHR